MLVRVGRHAATVSAEPPFRDEIGNCLPLEQFQGITLRSWVERYLSDAAAWPSLRSRLLMWERVARARHFAHSQGVVHRQLLPELISARTHLTSRTGVGVLHRYAIDLLDALAYLESRGITHKDTVPIDGDPGDILGAPASPPA